MERVYEFLKKCGTYFLATCDDANDGQPHVRPFGTIEIFDGKLCFQTGKNKPVSRQLHNNSKFEICAYNPTEQKWLRLKGDAVEEARIDAQVQMLNAYPELKNMYAPGDGVTEIFKIENATAIIASFTEPPVKIAF